MKNENTQIASEDVEKAIKEFVRGGGKVTQDVKRDEMKDEWEKIQLRIKKEAIITIDEIVGKTMGLTRTGWILQAIEEKFKRTNNDKM